MHLYIGKFGVVGKDLGEQDTSLANSNYFPGAQKKRWSGREKQWFLCVRVSVCVGSTKSPHCPARSWSSTGCAVQRSNNLNAIRAASGSGRICAVITAPFWRMKNDFFLHKNEKHKSEQSKWESHITSKARASATRRRSESIFQTDAQAACTCPSASVRRSQQRPHRANTEINRFSSKSPGMYLKGHIEMRKMIQTSAVINKKKNICFITFSAWCGFS